MSGLRDWIETIVYIIREAVTLGGNWRARIVALGLIIMAAYGIYLWIFQQHAPIFLHANYGGMILTGMNDSVIWGLYIAMFIFWVGVAAAGIAFGIAAYVFRDKEFMKFAVLGEVQAVAALVTVLLLIIVDLGRPIRALFLMPLLPNFPKSMLDWDFVVITGYLTINLIGFYVTTHYYRQDKALPNKFIIPFITIAAPFAIGIHTVTAFISQALTARPYWNSPLLAPAYVATAFAAGPAILLIALYLAEKYMEGIHVDFKVYKKTLYLMIGALVVGLYFNLSEVQEVYWYTTEPMKRAQWNVALFGITVPYVAVFQWLWVALGVAAVLASLTPYVRNSKQGIVLVAILVTLAVIFEKTLRVLVPAYIPDPLGQWVPYWPTPLEIAITVGVHAIGILVYLALAIPALRAVKKHYFEGAGAHH